jgi:sarcosine oxidase
VERVDVVVIGAGVVGSATARALGRRGARAIVFDRFRIGHTRGSSHGATRIFRLSYPQADYVRLARRALVTWRALEDDANEELLLTTGGLDTGPTAADCAAALAACGVDHRWLRPEEATERFPSISFEGIDRALHQPDAGVCLADRVVAAQVRLARQAGVEVREETPVHGIAANHQGVVVETDAGQVEATVAVITAGPWAGQLLAETGFANGFDIDIYAFRDHNENEAIIGYLPPS